MIKDRKVQESLPHHCPNIDLHSVEWGQKTLLESGEMLVEITKKPDGNLKAHLKAPKINFDAKLTILEQGIED